MNVITIIIALSPPKLRSTPAPFGLCGRRCGACGGALPPHFTFSSLQKGGGQFMMLSSLNWFQIQKLSSFGLQRIISEPAEHSVNVNRKKIHIILFFLLNLLRLAAFQNLLSYAVNTISNSIERWPVVSGRDLSTNTWILTVPSSSLKNVWRPNSLFASNEPQIFCNFACPNEMRT